MTRGSSASTANGQRANANYFTIDGVSANFGVTGYLPLFESDVPRDSAISLRVHTRMVRAAEACQWRITAGVVQAVC